MMIHSLSHPFAKRMLLKTNTCTHYARIQTDNTVTISTSSKIVLLYKYSFTATVILNNFLRSYGRKLRASRISTTTSTQDNHYAMRMRKSV